jgi:hypothetical protein
MQEKVTIHYQRQQNNLERITRKWWFFVLKSLYQINADY